MSNYKAMISDDIGLKVNPSTGKVSTIGRKTGVGLVTHEHVDIDPVTNLITDPIHRAAVGEAAAAVGASLANAVRRPMLPMLRDMASFDTDQTIVLLGDSTGNEPSEWFYQLATYIANNSPSNLNIRYALYDDANARYSADEVLKAGSGEPYVTVGADGRGWGVFQSAIGAVGGGDLDIMVDVQLDAYTGISEQVLMAQFGGASPNRAFRFYLNSSGTPYLSWSTTGSDAVTASATTPISAAAGSRIKLRVTLDVDNGASGYTVKFFTSTTDYTNWTQLGSTVTGGAATSIYSAAGQPVEIGSRAGALNSNTGGTTGPAVGRHYRPRLAKVIDGPNLLPLHVRDFGETDGMSGVRSTGPSLYILNGSIPGSNAAYIQTGDRLSRMLPKTYDAFLFVNTAHNEGVAWDPLTFTTNMVNYISAIKAIVPTLRLYVLTQNPKKPPQSATKIFGQMRRCEEWKLIARRADIMAEVIDTYSLFLGNEATWINVDGIHPDTLGKNAQAAKAIYVCEFGGS